MLHPRAGLGDGSALTLDGLHRLGVEGANHAREGVRWLWFADPLARTLEVNRREAAGWLQLASFKAGEPVRAEPFEAVELDTSDWFPEEAPESSSE